jgi:hypothetical protein
MGQGSLFSRSQIAEMRDPTAARNHSPSRDEFRREYQRRRVFGLQRRHAEKLRHSRRTGVAPLAGVTPLAGAGPMRPPTQAPRRTTPDFSPIPSAQRTPTAHEPSAAAGPVTTPEPAITVQPDRAVRPAATVGLVGKAELLAAGEPIIAAERSAAEPLRAELAAREPSHAEPAAVEPPIGEPSPPEPVAAEAVAAEAVAAEPAAAEAAAAEPVTAAPVIAEAGAVERVTVAPVIAEAAAAAPVIAELAAAEPTAAAGPGPAFGSATATVIVAVAGNAAADDAFGAPGRPVPRRCSWHGHRHRFHDHLRPGRLTRSCRRSNPSERTRRHPASPIPAEPVFVCQQKGPSAPSAIRPGCCATFTGLGKDGDFRAPPEGWKRISAYRELQSPTATSSTIGHGLGGGLHSLGSAGLTELSTTRFGGSGHRSCSYDRTSRRDGSFVRVGSRRERQAQNSRPGTAGRERQAQNRRPGRQEFRCPALRALSGDGRRPRHRGPGPADALAGGHRAGLVGEAALSVVAVGLPAVLGHVFAGRPGSRVRRPSWVACSPAVLGCVFAGRPGLRVRWPSWVACSLAVLGRVFAGRPG